MDQNLSNEDREAKFYDARVKENEDKISAEFRRIFTKRHVGVTQEDKAFLQARESYLSNADREEYKAELAENLATTGEQTSVGSGSTARPLEDYSRKELEARLQELGVQDTSLKVYRTNGDLITAIQELQSGQA